jgi:hypothetical protein
METTTVTIIITLTITRRPRRSSIKMPGMMRTSVVLLKIVTLGRGNGMKMKKNE